MKVAMISDCYPPRVGGIESQVRDLCRRLIEAGHEVEVFTATNGAAGQRAGQIEVVDGVIVHRLGARLPFGLPVNPGAKRHLRERLAAGGFDVAHVHVGVISPFAVDGGDIAVELGIPLTATWHCVLGRWEPIVRRLGHAERWAAAGAVLHGVSRMAADQVRRLAPDAQVGVLHNGIDVDRWRTDGPTTPTIRPAGVPLKVVLAMRFTPRKRPLAVLDLVRRARAEASTPITVEICGGGPLLSFVRGVVERRGWTDWVSLPGRIDRTRLVEHYRAADVYLASSRFESFGIAALEGRTVGLPVLALAGSGAEEFVTDRVTGLVRDGDAGLIAGLVELAESPDLVRQLRWHNERVPPAQDWATIVGAAETEYARAVGALDPQVPEHPSLAIEALDESGAVVERFDLDHGADPGAELLRRGWSTRRGVEVRRDAARLTVVLGVAHTPSAVSVDGSAADRVEVQTAADGGHFEVDPQEERDGEWEEVPVEEGLTVEEIAGATPYQRIAAYALVESGRGVLLTELSAKTWTPGLWTLPGGGIDAGESALEAVHREVWEETGQTLTDVDFLGTRTAHWIGRSPGGRVEDFHAVRLYYRAVCPDPTDPVVHDADGSTASAAWVPRAALAELRLVESLGPALAQWLA